MNYEQAKAHNDKIQEKIRELQGNMLHRYRVMVVERIKGGGRQVAQQEDTDYITASKQAVLYEQYRAMYPEKERYFVVINELEELQRTVSVREPVRTDDDRQGPAHVSDVGLKEIPDDLGEAINLT
jgi:hypothetical protein